MISCTFSCNTSCVILGNYYQRCIESIMKLSILRKYVITGGFRNAHAFTNWIKSDFPSFGLLLINLVCFFSSSSPSAIISHYNGFFFSLLILHCLIQTRSQLQQLIRCSFLCMQIKLSIEQQATSKLTTVFF